MRSWFSFNSNVTWKADSFARTLGGKLLGIQSAIIEATSDNLQHVLLVAHFPDTFELLQQMLEEQRIEYEVPTVKLNQDWFVALPFSGCRVSITFAEMLETLKPTDFRSDTRLSVLVAERHPLLAEERAIDEFCRSLPCKVQRGYFLSFEDAVVSQLLDERAIQILDMFGMGQNELINSKLLSNSLDHALKKLSGHAQDGFPANSAAEWLKHKLG